jgi:nucleoside-diphosphate-sugar epimerase
MTDIVIIGGCGHVGLPLGLALQDSAQHDDVRLDRMPLGVRDRAPEGARSRRPDDASRN